MKKTMYTTLSILLMLMLLTGCKGFIEPYSIIPKGYTSKEEHFDKDGFQDYTDFCKYTYSSVEPFTNNSKFKVVEEKDLAIIQIYFSDFENWMRTSNRMDEYSFDRSWINTGDYILINTKEGAYLDLNSYDIYYFDVETMTLYYIHNNI